MKKILVAEDEQNIREFVVINLERAGYFAVEAETGDQALELYAQDPEGFDVAVLDIMMPGLHDGLAVCKELRRHNSSIGIILLSAKTQEMDKVSGLMMGADDYVTKPFNPMELTARVKSQLRRYTSLGDIHSSGENTIVNGRLCFNLDEHVLYADGEPVKLTATETKIVELLMRNPGRIFPAEEIYSKIWNESAYSTENTVMVHIRRIREKIEINPGEPEYLKVVWGIGYKFEKH